MPLLPAPTVVRRNSRGDWYVAFYPLHKRYGGSWSCVFRAEDRCVYCHGANPDHR